MKIHAWSLNLEESNRMMEEEEKSAARKRKPYEVIEELKRER